MDDPNRNKDFRKDTAFHDPNWKKEPKHEKTVICKYCNALHEGKGWVALQNMNPKDTDHLPKGVCPACHLGKGHLSDGVLHLTGTFLESHKQEIMNTIHNIEKLAVERDVLNRIERIEDDKPGEIHIYTTKNRLAVKIGKHISNEFKGGELDIKFSKEDQPAEVKWHKDL